MLRERVNQWYAERRKAKRLVSLSDRCKRSARRIIVIVLLLMISICLGCVLLGMVVEKALAYAPPEGIDVILLIDNSNSMFDKGGVGSDPELHRIESAQLFINYLGVDSSETGHRLGIISFGGDAKVLVPLSRLSEPEHRTWIANAIANPERMDWTDPYEALALARKLLNENPIPQQERVVVLLTDGKPEWDTSPLLEERKEVIQALSDISQVYATEGIRLYIVLLENEATDADPEIADLYIPLWQAMSERTDGHFYAIRKAENLIDVYHDVLLLVNHMQSEGPVVETLLDGTPQTHVIAIEPNLKRVTFVIRTVPTVHTDRATDEFDVRLFHPDGTIIQASNMYAHYAAYGNTAIWSVDSPIPGEWMITLMGEGNVTVWKDYLPTPVALPIEPTPTPTLTPSPTPEPTFTPDPTYTPTPVTTLTILDWQETVLVNTDVIIRVLPDTDLPTGTAIWAKWTSESGLESVMQFYDDGHLGDDQSADGVYTIAWQPADTGIYTVRLWYGNIDKQAGGWHGRMKVVAHPHLSIDMPQPKSVWKAGRDVQLLAHWNVFEGRILNGNSMTITISKTSGSDEITYYGIPGDPLRISAPREAGEYLVEFKASGQLSDLTFFDRSEVMVRIRKPLPFWVFGTAPTLGLAALGGWRGWCWYKELPRLIGTMLILKPPAKYRGPMVLDLSSLYRRSIIIGGKKSPLPINDMPVMRLKARVDGIELEVLDGLDIRINGKSVLGVQSLSDSDKIEVAGARLKYEVLLPAS